MMKKEAPTVNVLALAWYRPDEWLKLRAVAQDAAALESTHAEWLAHAEGAVREAQSAGLRIVKVEVAVDELVAWCQKRKLRVDGQARAQYAAEWAENQ